ncbi:MAG TPA: molybdopterin cofactor-binding domain-containing protein, partial [Amycolatopsis sp.]|nr:molybdopterin cofactor-binding domain-containing protein [Amycolatopsis sp.]
MTATAEPEVGRSRRRKEDERLITGRTRWTDNITLPGMLHAAVLRSPYAHAKIVSIDTSSAKTASGVVAVYTAKDLDPDGSIGMPCAWSVTPDMKAPRRPVLADGQVNFAGEGVAVVVARSAAEARDALDEIDIEYDELPVVLDMEAALADGAPLVHEDIGTNKNALWVFDSGEAGTGGNVEEAISSSEVVLKRRFRQQRLIPSFMEPRACVVDPTGQHITMWSATQVPHILKTMASLTVGIPEHKLRVIAPDVGGGFGGK